MKILALLIICIVSVDVIAQGFTVEEIKDISEDGVTFIFPVVHYPNKDIGNRINNVLQKSELGLIIGEQEKSIFERIWITSESQGAGTSSFGYDIMMNTSRIFTLQFGREDCGAFCEGYFKYYNFDAQTGELIDPVKLFTEKALEQIKQTVYEGRRKAINMHRVKARDTNNAPAFEIYEGCLEELSREDLYKGGFFFEPGKIYFIREACGTYLMRDVDELGSFQDEFTFKTIKKNLSPYGKALIK